MSEMISGDEKWARACSMVVMVGCSMESWSMLLGSNVTESFWPERWRTDRVLKPKMEVMGDGEESVCEDCEPPPVRETREIQWKRERSSPILSQLLDLLILLPSIPNQLQSILQSLLTKMDSWPQKPKLFDEAVDHAFQWPSRVLHEVYQEKNTRILVHLLVVHPIGQNPTRSTNPISVTFTKSVWFEEKKKIKIVPSWHRT